MPSHITIGSLMHDMCSYEVMFFCFMCVLTQCHVLRVCLCIHGVTVVYTQHSASP